MNCCSMPLQKSDVSLFGLSMKTIKLILIAVVVFSLVQITFAQVTIDANWHQWRGPAATGQAGAESNPPTQWSESKNIAWKVAIEGEGSSTPIIWNDCVYLIAAVETDRTADKPHAEDPEAKTAPTGNIFDFKAICLNRNTGEEIWKKNLVSAAPHEGRHPSTTYAAASPITDGEHLFVSFGSYGIFCLSLDGEILWQRDLGNMRTRRGWGEAVSPAVTNDKLIVMWDQEDESKIFALNKSDGSTVWEKRRDEPTTWATPLIVKHNEEIQIITSGTNGIRSYESKGGNLLWETTGLTVNAIPSPLHFENNVILMSGYRGNKAVSLGLDDEEELQPVTNWELQKDTPYVPSPLLTNGRVYFTKSNNAILSCVDARSGKPVFEMTRLPGLNNLYASPVATEKHIYFSSREGATLVIENRDRFKVVGTNQLEGGIDASPAIAGNQIFIRSKTHLYCIQDKSDTELQDQTEETKPGINANFLDPNLDVEDFVRRFEIESREVFASRLEILKNCELKRGNVIADIGAGTGLFTRMFSRSVDDGWVYAVDIAPKFLDHIRKSSDEIGLTNITPVLCGEDSVSLPANSIDVAFICDTYHHFEHHEATLASIHKALKEDGRLIVIDFNRIPGKTREWLLNHVRAGKEVFQAEIVKAGFELIEDRRVAGLEENYFLIFEK